MHSPRATHARRCRASRRSSEAPCRLLCRSRHLSGYRSPLDRRRPRGVSRRAFPGAPAPCRADQRRFAPLPSIALPVATRTPLSDCWPGGSRRGAQALAPPVRRSCRPGSGSLRPSSRAPPGGSSESVGRAQIRQSQYSIRRQCRRPPFLAKTQPYPCSNPPDKVNEKLLPFCLRHDIAVKGGLFQALHRGLVDHVFGLQSSHFRIGHHEKALHVLYSFEIKLDIEAVEPLERLVSTLRLLNTRQP